MNQPGHTYAIYDLAPQTTLQEVDSRHDLAQKVLSLSQ